MDDVPFAEESAIPVSSASCYATLLGSDDLILTLLPEPALEEAAETLEGVVGVVGATEKVVR